ncbi:hypothetical protein GX411_09775 [Candidatus Fermentibacteria bacterium]|nr:hypothetical protein [Candidatus Fermentibacteria bacterium]
MKGFREAAELALAFSQVIHDLNDTFSQSDHLPVSSDTDFEAYQAFMARLVLLQRELEEFIDRAMALETTMQDAPSQVLDFSSEWEGF